MADGTYGEITTVSLYKGPATSLTREFEQTIRLFIEDCYHMGIPRCKGKLAVDIQQYLIRNNMELVPNFVNQKPGNVIICLGCEMNICNPDIFLYVFQYEKYSSLFTV